MTKTLICAIIILPMLSFVSIAYSSFSRIADHTARYSANDALPVAEQQKYAPGELLVKYKASFSFSAVQNYHLQQNIMEIRHFQNINVHHIKLPADITVGAAISNFRSNTAVEYVEPNYIHRVCGTPSDVYYSSLWGLQNTGQEVNGETGTPGADINAPPAWDIIVGNSAIIIALIDTGVDYHHPDLAANISSMRHNFIDNNNDPMDVHGHGTHVAGIIAATGNNEAGVTGVAWSASLMPLRAGNALGLLYISDIIAAIDYARMNGAKIINASFGGSDFSRALYDSIAAAGNAGILFVAAAGNGPGNNDSSPFYPANYQLGNIISVAATSQSDELSYFSNYGAGSVHVGAPGQNIFSTTFSPPSQDSDTITEDYQFMSGTSMSTAYVSGLAALIWGYNPDLAYFQVKDIILRSVDSKSSLLGKTISGGRINAFKALNFCMLPSAPDALSASALSHREIRLAWAPNSYTVSYVLERKKGTAGNYQIVATLDGKLNQYVNDGLEASSFYSYRMKAVNYGGESSYSNEADAKTSLSVSVKGNGDEVSSSGCFIATAAFGSPFHSHVQILRTFRDHYLLQFAAGKIFVKYYYKMSPPIARTISEYQVLRLLTRWSLLPLIGVSYLMITLGAIPTMLGFVWLIIGIAYLTWRMRWKREGRYDGNMNEYINGGDDARIQI